MAPKTLSRAALAAVVATAVAAGVPVANASAVQADKPATPAAKAQAAKAAKADGWVKRTPKWQRLKLSKVAVTGGRAAGPNAVIITRDAGAPRAMWLQQVVAPTASDTEVTALGTPRTIKGVRSYKAVGKARKIWFKKGQTQLTVTGLAAGQWRLQTTTRSPLPTAPVVEVHGQVAEPSAAEGRTVTDPVTGEPILGAIDVSFSHMRGMSTGGGTIAYRVFVDPLDGEGQSRVGLANPGDFPRDDAATPDVDESRTVVRINGLSEQEPGYVITVQAINAVSQSEKIYKTLPVTLGEIRKGGGVIELTPIPERPAAGSPTPAAPATDNGEVGSGDSTPNPNRDSNIRTGGGTEIGPGVYDEAAQTITFSLRAPQGMIPGAMDSGPLPRISWSGIDSAGQAGTLVLGTDPALINAVTSARDAAAAAAAAFDAALTFADVVRAQGVADPVTGEIAYTDPDTGAVTTEAAAMAAVAAARTAALSATSAVSAAEAALYVGQDSKMVFGYAGGFGGAEAMEWSITEHLFDVDGGMQDGSTTVHTIPRPPAVSRIMTLGESSPLFECDLANDNDPGRAAGMTVTGTLTGTECTADANVTGATGAGGSAGGTPADGFVLIRIETTPYTYTRENRAYTYTNTAPPSYGADVLQWLDTDGDGVFDTQNYPSGSPCPWGGSHNGSGLCVYPANWVKDATPAGYSDDGSTWYRMVKDATPAGYVDNGTEWEMAVYGVNTDPASIPTGYGIRPALLNPDGTPVEYVNDLSWAVGAYVRPADRFVTYTLTAQQLSDVEMAELGVSQVWIAGQRWYAAGSGGGWVQGSSGDLGRCPVAEDPTVQGIIAALRGPSGSSTHEYRPCN